MTNSIIISIAVGSPEQAERIGAALVEARLVACVQQHAIKSRYIWQGKIEVADEIMLTAKTQVELFGAVEKLVLSLHDYEVPDIVATPITAGHAPYLDWIAAETSQSR